MSNPLEEVVMGEAKKTKPEASAVRTALKKLSEHKLHDRLRQVDGQEPHRVLPEIWPIIQELCTIADAAEAEMLHVKN